jgi:hypothetical protein
MPVVRPSLPPLPIAERGFVLGLCLAGAPPAAARRVRGPWAERCAHALEALAEAAPEAREAMLDELRAATRAEVPAGLALVHPGWIRRALEGEPAAIVRAAVSGLGPEVERVADELLAGRGEDESRGKAGLPSEAAGALRQILFGNLAPMPVGVDGEALPIARALCELAPAALLAEIDRRGAALLGRSLAGAPAGAIARAAAVAGEPLARVIIDAAAAQDQDARAAARELVAASQPQQGAFGAPRAIGLRALARELAAEGSDASAAVAQRLPPAVGDVLLEIAIAEERA